MNNTLAPHALIVGGSSGMGLATAKLLLNRGIRVVIIGNNPAKLDAAKRMLTVFGQIETLQANLYAANDVERVTALAQDHERPIKYLVNAAGYFKPTPFLEHVAKDYDTYLDLNRASFSISQAVAKT